MFLEFIKTPYCVFAPLLLLLIFFKGGIGRVSANLLAVMNLLLIGHAVFLTRQLFSLYHIARIMGDQPAGLVQQNTVLLSRLALVALLPVFTLWPGVRNNPWFALIMLLLLYWVFPPQTWNLVDMHVKLAAFFCLVCAAYALLWLLNKLPYQTSPR